MQSRLFYPIRITNCKSVNFRQTIFLLMTFVSDNVILWGYIYSLYSNLY